MDSEKQIGNDFELFSDDLKTIPRPEAGKILVTGATGYIGGRLVPELLARGYKVRVMMRSNSPDLQNRWPDAEFVEADALDLEKLVEALEGIHTAYYLIHSLMLGHKNFEAADIQAATNFKFAAENKGIKRVIYLSGLGDIEKDLSPHLESRNKVSEKLTSDQYSLTVLRAGMIIGSGSASYEILSNLVKNSKIFFIPYWAKTLSQPIAVRDVIKYLIGVLENDESCNKVLDIGGNSILTYDEKLKILSGLLGKKRYFFPALITSPSVYGYIAGLLTPVPGPVTKVLVQGCKNEVTCQNEEIRELVKFEPLSFKQALIGALSNEEKDRVATRWTDSYPPAHELSIKLYQLKPAPKYTSAYCILTHKKTDSLFRSFCKIGGKMGWFHSNWMWRMRGMIDSILLGVGSVRGRRSATELRVNDVIDFFRVEDIVQDKFLLLRAEMKLPGKAWLEFNLDSYEGLNRLSINAYFHPKGILGKIYWYFFLPFHFYIFKDLINQIEKQS